MDPEAFINCLYGCMSKKRKKLVLRVFDKLDTTGTGHVKLDQVGRTMMAISERIVHLESLIMKLDRPASHVPHKRFVAATPQVLDAFHATKHPDAISGCRSPDVIFKDFVESFIEGLPSEKRTNLRVRDNLVISNCLACLL